MIRRIYTNPENKHIDIFRHDLFKKQNFQDITNGEKDFGLVGIECAA